MTWYLQKVSHTEYENYMKADANENIKRTH